MSIVEATGRIAELQALLAQATGRVTAPTAATTAGAATTGSTTTGGGSPPFSTALQQASFSTGSSPYGAVGTTPYGAAGAAPLASTGAGGATVVAAPPGVPTGGSDGGALAPLIQAAAQRHGIDPQVFTNLVRQESGFDPNAGSPAGARGLCQLMPGTAAGLGVTDVTDPAQSLEGGAKYLRQQLDRFGGDYVKGLAAYNAGPGAVQRHGGVPPYAETQHYVATILGRSAA